MWLDLENPGDRRLRAFGESLGMNDPALQALTAVSQRPSSDVAADSIRAVVPSSNRGRGTGDILGIQVVFTERFLLTAHSGPCRALAGVQRGWDDLPHEVKAGGPAARHPVWTVNSSGSAASCPRLSRHSDGTSAIFITSRAPASCRA